MIIYGQRKTVYFVILDSTLHEQLIICSLAEKKSNWDNVVLAYELVWAIGTGKVATPAGSGRKFEFMSYFI